MASGVSHGDDLSIPLERHPGRRLEAPAEISRLPTVAGEGRVGRAVGVVAGEREVSTVRRHFRRPPRSCRRPGARPGRVDRDESRWSACRRRRSSCRACRRGCSGRVRSRRGAAASRRRRSCRPLGPPRRSPGHCRRNQSSASRHRRSSCRASRWGCIGRARSRRGRGPPLPDGDDLAVLERHSARQVAGGTEVSRLPAVAGEARVERAVRVEASEPEVASDVGVNAIAVAADHDDLAIALNGDPVRRVTVPELGRLLSVVGEARVERAVGVVAGDREVVATAERTPEAVYANYDDLAVRLGAPPPWPENRNRDRSRSSSSRRRRSSCRAFHRA